MKLTILLSLASAAFTSTLQAQTLTDVTSEYMSNASFESDDISQLTADNTRGAYAITALTGWTLSGSYGVSDIMTSAATATDNNLGRPGQPSNGTQMYYIRNAWSNGTASLKQSVTLPEGHYRFAVDNKCATPGTSSSGKIVAGDDNTTLTLLDNMPQAWRTTHVDFEVAKAGTVNIGLEFTWINSAGASFLLDNCRLYRLPNDYTPPQDPTEESVSSYTEGVITNAFVDEATMKRDLMDMLAKFATYMNNDWNQCAAPNSLGESCGFFKGENSGANDERGVRPNADLSMICAFLAKYGKPAGVVLPQGVTWDRIEEMAMKSLIFAYSTHKANKLKVCSGGNYWGSVSNGDHVWESSLWAMSVAYSAYFQWDKLSDAQRDYIYRLLKAECNYELERSIPTGYQGDTKAEENGWEADVLAATLGLFPNDPLAPRWFERLREFAINSYSHPSDKDNHTVIDPWYDQKTVAQLYRGQNLYDDYSLQNHNLFHTSYQNVVMQELGEAALALKMFQQGLHGEERWKTNALMHHNQEVQDSILNWLALADGELAMPNGNDWSLFLYDQITSYSTQACFQHDANALLLENLAYKYIQARQKTTEDGSWLLRADVGARRMGVEAHRVMMTYLMHEVMSTADMTPKSWDDFNSEFSSARLLPCQNIVRAASNDRFTCFSWSDGLKSYTGYFAANSADKNKIVVPYRANNTGNLLGWYEVKGQTTDAQPIVKGKYQLKGNAYVMNGEVNTNGATLNNRFALYSTPGNALIYLDYVTAKTSATITSEKGGLLAISTDELMKTRRTLYYGNEATRHKQLEGSEFTTMQSEWVNIDNELGVVGRNGKQIAFGDRGQNNSIYTSKLYPIYSNEERSVRALQVVDSRNLVYYSRIDAPTTKALYDQLQVVTNLNKGWNGVIAADPNGVCYLLVANFKGANREQALAGITCQLGAPVFAEETSISGSASSATVKASMNQAVGEELRIYIKGSGVTAQQDSEDACKATITNTSAQRQTIEVTIISHEGEQIARQLTLGAGKGVQVSVVDGVFREEETQETAIEVITTTVSHKAYDLNGRPAQPSTRGIVIEGGRKITK